MYSREISPQLTLTLASSGWTYRNTFILYDYETRSLWFPLPGTTALTCIQGPLRDKILPQQSSIVTRWHSWYQQHPATKILHRQK